MPRLISVEVKSLGQLFEVGPGFRLPWFQRAYSWQTQQVARLVGDLIEAMAGPQGESYPLGTVMLADVPGKDGLAIVDGHQRIVTLTILAAVLRDLEPPGAIRTLLEGFVRGAGGSSRPFRLVPQANVAEFLAAAVQRDGATTADFDESETPFSDSERRIVEVREYLRSRLAGASSATRALRRNLARFLSDRCRVIVHLYDSEEYAWRELSVEEDTRLAFDPAAQAKSTILGVMPDAEREAAGQIWEDCEERIGVAAMGELLGHIRTLKSRRRSEKPLEHEICVLFELHRTGRPFVNEWLKPHAAILESMRARRREPSTGDVLPDGARDAIERMGWIEPRFWVPAALHWLSLRGAGDPETIEFFRRLDRLVWMLRIAGIDPPLQRRRIIEVVDELDKGGAPRQLTTLAIEDALSAATVESLRAQNFCLKSHAAAVLRRISAIRGRDPGPVDKKMVTVEHILPRNPDRNRRWWGSFLSKQDVKAHVNRLGNLTFLTHADNQLAATKDWPEKRMILARSGFVLSEDVASVERWDRAAIAERTEELIAILMRDWEPDHRAVHVALR